MITKHKLHKCEDGKHWTPCPECPNERVRTSYHWKKKKWMCSVCGELFEEE